VPPEDNWTQVTTPDKLIGLWEGAASVDTFEDSNAGVPASSLDVRMNLSYEDQAEVVDSIMTIDMERYFDAGVSSPAAQAAGITKDAMWDLYIGTIADGTVGDKYYWSIDYTDTPENTVASEARQIFVNDDMTKLKMVFVESVSFNLSHQGLEEIILNKVVPPAAEAPAAE
jgi:hypothetical protein